MLVGLLRQRLDGMGQFLWKQVGRTVRCLNRSDSSYFAREKGHIWLFLATIAEVPPTVSPIIVSVLLALA
jgi:hypothetical protein